MPGKTFAEQDRLPRLPVLDLQETCDKFLAWVAPLLSAEEMERTERVVARFREPGGEGEKLQQRLLEWAERPDLPNWIEPFWDEMYLTFRPPIALNVNFAFVMEEVPESPHRTQVQRAAELVRSCFRFQSLIDREALEVDREKDQPLCMLQYKRLLNASRIPGRGRDELRVFPSARHVVVFHEGRIYRVNGLDPSGEVRSREAIEADLAFILADRELGPGLDRSIGALTALSRGEWVDAREALVAHSEHNRAALETIDSALCALCLDETTPETEEEVLRTVYHGDGKNRWFDKSIQLIVTRNGKVGINVEHSGVDGTTVIRFFEFLHREVAQPGGDRAGEGSASHEPPTRVTFGVRDTFELNDTLARHINDAVRDFNALVEDTKAGLLCFRRFGKGLIKSLGSSPDAFVQVALQAAQCRAFGDFGSTYESVVTRRFLHNRTETQRSVTPEAVAFARALSSEDVSSEHQAALLRGALSAHSARVRQCRAGQGVDRHLYGLFNIYERFGEELGIVSRPELFEDTGWAKLRHDRLSTSSCNSAAVDWFGFGPTVENGLGVGYVVKEDRMNFCVTSRSYLGEKLDAFVRHLERSLLEMVALLETHNKE